MVERWGWARAAVPAAISLVLIAGSASYACVPQPFVVIHPQSSGAVGSQVTVNGQLFETARVEIRWNATDGPLLATAQSTDFAVPLTVPSAPPGLYTLIAFSRGANGVLGSVARAEFQVTGPAPVPVTESPVRNEAATESSNGASFASVAAAVGLVAIGAFGGAAVVARRRPRATVAGPFSEPG